MKLKTIKNKYNYTMFRYETSFFLSRNFVQIYLLCIILIFSIEENSRIIINNVINNYT